MIRLNMVIALICCYMTSGISFYEPSIGLHDDSLMHIQISISDLHEAPLCKGILLNLWHDYKTAYDIPFNEELDVNYDDKHTSYSKSFCTALIQVMDKNPLFSNGNKKDTSHTIYRWFNKIIKPIFKLIHDIPTIRNGHHWEFGGCLIGKCVKNIKN